MSPRKDDKENKNNEQHDKSIDDQIMDFVAMVCAAIIGIVSAIWYSLVEVVTYVISGSSRKKGKQP